MRTRTLLMLLALLGLIAAVFYWMKQKGTLNSLMKTQAPTPTPAPSIASRTEQAGSDATAVIIGSIAGGVAHTISDWFGSNKSSTTYGDYTAKYNADGITGTFI